MSAGKSSPPRDACHYGVPRDQCRVGCGYRCSATRRSTVPREDIFGDPVPAFIDGPLPDPATCCGGCNLPAGHKPCRS